MFCTTSCLSKVGSVFRSLVDVDEDILEKFAVCLFGVLSLRFSSSGFLSSASGLFPFSKELLHLLNLVVKRSKSSLVGNASIKDYVNPLRKSSKGMVCTVIHRINHDGAAFQKAGR